jgi:hypothetical protein
MHRPFARDFDAIALRGVVHQFEIKVENQEGKKGA